MTVVDWLLDSDPAIRWQVLRDVVRAPSERVAAERARVGIEGWGGDLLGLQAPDGGWGGGTFTRDWTCTFYSLVLLRELGIDPSSDASRKAIGLVNDRVTWRPYFADHRLFEGEVEPCINGRVLGLGAYFGEPNAALLQRLLHEQLDDGGWNCEAPPSKRSSFNTTICVLEGLLAYETACGAAPSITAARLAGEEYLLKRSLLRTLSTGEIINPTWLLCAYPTYWHYDLLRGLDYLRSAGVRDERAAEAVDSVSEKRGVDGRWVLENLHQGVAHFAMDAGVGEPSRWNTLRALRVLEWWAGGARVGCD